MELRKFKEKNHKKVGIILFTITCILLISGVILYRTFAIFQVDTTQNVINGSIEDPGDLYFAFYKDGVIQNEMPQKDEGYMLDKQSFCGVNGVKDEKIIPSLDRDTWSIIVTGMKSSRTKCNLYFTKTYDDTTLYDLSGNNYNGTFQNGAIVQKDEENNLGIYFDGTDDYVDIDDLPASINWESGFTIEFEAMWKAFPYYSRIFEFGNGTDSDNIFVSNMKETNQLTFATRYGMQSDNSIVVFQYDQDNKAKINQNEKACYKLIIIKNDNNMQIDIYKNLIFQDTIPYLFKNGINNILRNILRVENYLGRSSWTGTYAKDAYFYGYIYSLKITDSKNNIILWYDF